MTKMCLTHFESPIRTSLRTLEVGFACIAPLLFLGHFSGENIVEGIMQFAMLVVTPITPFVLLCLAVDARRNDGRYRYHIIEIIGATLGAMVSLDYTARLAWKSLNANDEVGADIGIGIILLLMPVYVPIAMAVGYSLGKLLWMSFAFYPYVMNILLRPFQTRQFHDRR